MRDFAKDHARGSAIIEDANRGALQLTSADPWDALLLPWIACQEGEGDPNNAAPGDRGGITRYGWASATWGLEWVQSLTWDTAARAYKDRITAAFPPPPGQVWTPAQGLLLADTWIQHSKAVLLLQRATADVLSSLPPGGALRLDGVWGPKTAAAFQAAPVQRLAVALCQHRLLHVAPLMSAEHKVWTSVWVRRYTSCAQVALALGGGAP